MGDLNKIPGDSEQEVVFLSDSSSESSEEIIRLPGRNVGTDITVNINISDTKQNNDLSGGSGTNVDVLNQANQLIDWINHYDNQRAQPSHSLRNMFAGGYRFIESFQSRFKEAHKAIVAKDVEINEVNGQKDLLQEENEELRRQLEAKNGELEKLKRRNARLEEERRQRKADVMPLGKMRSKVDNLQFVFERLVGKMDEEPVDLTDPMSVQKKHELEVFQRDVGALFNKVQYKLRKWERNQRDMEGELETTKLALDRLNDMVLFADMKRLYSKEPELVERVRDTSSVQEIMPPPPPLAEPSTSQRITHSKKKKMPPPPLFPLATEETPPPIPVFARPVVPGSSRYLQQQQIDLQMLASALSTLQHVPQLSVPMETAPPPPNILQRMHLNVMPPPPPIYNHPTPLPQKPLFSNGPVRAALSHHIQSQNALKSRQVSSFSKVPPLPPPQLYSQQYSNQPQEPQPSTSRGLTGKSAAAGGSKTPSYSKYKKIAPYPATRSKGTRPKTSSFTATCAGGEVAANGNPVNQNTDGVPPTANPSNVGSTENGENPDPATPTGGLNICGLCGAAYNTLVQLKLHHAVIHAKSSAPAAVVPEVPQPCQHSQNNPPAQQQQQQQQQQPPLHHHHQYSQATSVVQLAPTSTVPSTSTQVASTSTAAIASANFEYEQYLRQRILELASGYPMPSGSRSWVAQHPHAQTLPPPYQPQYVKPPTPPAPNEMGNNDNDATSRNFTNTDENM